MSAPGKATARFLPDGRRLHLQHGPIDLVIEASGDPAEVEAAYMQAVRRFDGLLGALVAELPRLRSYRPDGAWGLKGRVARRMERAVRPFLPAFVTPMAAVAGAVAEEVLEALCAGRVLSRAYVNNGGDIALFLAPGARFDIGLVEHPLDDRPVGKLVLTSDVAARGVATSGRHGRSLSRGIADAVTVVAESAAKADAAATLIANAVDLPDSSKVRRAAARDVDPDSDLGTRQVTVEITELTAWEANSALDRGASYSAGLLRDGTIDAAVLMLNGEIRFVGMSRPTDTGIHNFALERPREGSLHA